MKLKPCPRHEPHEWAVGVLMLSVCLLYCTGQLGRLIGALFGWLA